MCREAKLIGTLFWEIVNSIKLMRRNGWNKEFTKERDTIVAAAAVAVIMMMMMRRNGWSKKQSEMNGARRKCKRPKAMWLVV